MSNKKNNMKNVFKSLLIVMLSLAFFNAGAQGNSASYFVGKWNMLAKETPNGDVVLPARFEMIDGKLKGYFTDPASKEEKKMDTVFIENDKCKMAFNVMSYDITIYLAKKDDNNAVGSLMDMFTVEAARQKESTNYFEGKWNVLVKDTPNGDVTLITRFEMKDGKINGYFIDPTSKEEKKMDAASIENDQLKVAFNVMNYDVTVTLAKKDDNNAVGKLMDMFEVQASRKKD
jgi:6-pyruvoyl-tetrahydropterin synthase